MKKNYVFIILSVLFISCKSTKGFSGKADFCGIITDSNNQGIPGYSISINNVKTITNDSGIFLAPGIKAGKVKIYGNMKGFENIETESLFSDQNSFFCIQIKNEKEIFAEVEKSIEEHNLEKAEKLLTSFSPTQDGKKIIPLYKSLINYKNKKYLLAKNELLKINIEDKKVFDDYKKILEKKLRGYKNEKN